MFTIALIIHIIVSLVMIVSVLLQVGKGASMGSAFGGSGSQTLFGSSGPATFLGKITAVCAGIFMLTSLYLTFLSSRARTSSIMTDVPVEAGKESPAQGLPEGMAGPQGPAGKAPVQPNQPVQPGR
ncbi:MAG: preprotein translocase subunit SecG [Deltaproteobacteria bacterium]